MSSSFYSTDFMPAGHAACGCAPYTEGSLREALAAYFLSAPPPERQTPAECARYRRALRKMAEIEIDAILQSAAVRRPLRYGDLTALLAATAEAAAKRLEESGITLACELPEKTVCTAAEPRLLQMAAVYLLRMAAAANPDGELFTRVRIQPHSVSIAVAGNHPFGDPRTLSLIRAAARAHKGGAAVSGGTVAFSLRRELPGAIGLFAAPSADELLSNPLSPINVGLA